MAIGLSRLEHFVIKLGEHGAHASYPSGSFPQPGFQVDTVVGTVGAGDGFAVGMTAEG